MLLTEILEVLKIINANPESTVHSSPDIKKFFFEEFMGGIAKRIIQTKNT
jgi:hypothetical protein